MQLKSECNVVGFEAKKQSFRKYLESTFAVELLDVAKASLPLNSSRCENVKIGSATEETNFSVVVLHGIRSIRFVDPSISDDTIPSNFNSIILRKSKW